MNDSNERNGHEVVVHTTSTSSAPVCSVETIPMDLSYYRCDDHTYALLEPQQVCFHKVEHCLNIHVSGLINRITLDDFPMGQYTLSIDGINCATARFNPKEGCCEFNFTGQQSPALQGLIAKQIQSSTDPDSVINRSQYIQGNCRIFYSSIELNTKHTMTLYKRDGPQHLNFYPYDTYTIKLSHPTETIDVSVNNTAGQIMLLLNGQEMGIYGRTGNEMDGQIRIRCHNPQHLFEGNQNKHLPDLINRNTINMSFVDQIDLVVIGCQILSVSANSYNIYYYPSRVRLYAN